MREGALANAASVAVLAFEVLGTVVMWVVVPVGWVWVGARVYDATGSFLAGSAAWFVGFVATLWLAVAVLTRTDQAWMALRRRAGHDQVEGVLTNIVVVSATLVLVAFFLWFYVI